MWDVLCITAGVGFFLIAIAYTYGCERLGIRPGAPLIDGAGTGNPASGNPGTGGAGSGAPGTGDPGTGDPGTGDRKAGS